MADQQLSKDEQLIAFFVSQCDGRIGKTQLMKFIYLADYEARRYLGRGVSNMDYIWYHYGPYDASINEKINSLEEKHVIRTEEEQYPTGKTGFRYSRGDQEVAYSFDPDELAILAYICETYSQVPLQVLLADIVYETEPMKQAQEQNAKNERLDMDMVNGTRRYELGLAFEELLARSRRARLGKKLSWEKMLERLTLAEQKCRVA